MQKYEYSILYPEAFGLADQLNNMNKISGWRPILSVGDRIVLERPIDEVKTVDLHCVSKDIIDAYVKRMNTSKKRLK